MESQDSIASIRECLFPLLHKLYDVGSKLTKKSNILFREMANINHGDTSSLEKVGLGMIQAFETLEINVADITNPLQETLQKVNENRSEDLFEDLKLKIFKLKKTLAATDTMKCLNKDTQTEDSYSTPEVEPDIKSQENYMANSCRSVKEINLGLRRTDSEDLADCRVDGINRSPTAVELWNRRFQGKKINVTEESSQADEVASMKTTTEQYRQLEGKHKESELAYKKIITKKNAYIHILKKELETAVTASKLVRSSPSYSELYSKYNSVSEQYANKEEECARLSNYNSCIVKEAQEKDLLIKTLRKDNRKALDAYESMKEAHADLLNKLHQLREDNSECKRLRGVTVRENERLKNQVTDLSRQVGHLLLKMEQSGIGGSSSTSAAGICSAEIITKKCITFSYISELQTTNQKVLAPLRDLTERQEEVESLDPAAISILKMKLADLQKSYNELLVERDCQNKITDILRSQRDRYKNMYSQAVKASGEKVPTQTERLTRKLLSNSEKKISALKKQNKIYHEAIIKHQQAVKYLKDKTLRCQTKLSQAEVMLGKLMKENALLKDAEQRLVKERELIKATLERNDAEVQLKRDSRQDEAHQKCSALQDQPEKLRKELIEARGRLIMKNELQRQPSDVQDINKSLIEQRKAVGNKYAREVITSHSTNTQTQSGAIRPQRSASVRVMSAHPRTIAVLPTSQSPSAVTVPTQQQAHTTDSSTVEELFISRATLRDNYVPATTQTGLKRQRDPANSQGEEQGKRTQVLPINPLPKKLRNGKL